MTDEMCNQTTPKLTLTFDEFMERLGPMLRQACRELRPFGVSTPEEAIEIADRNLREIFKEIGDA